MTEKPVIEKWAEDEYREGVSAGAAMRQLCRLLGCSGAYPKLKEMMEDVLADRNRASFDRSQILAAFREAAPEAAESASRESFYRNNPDAPISQHRGDLQ
ncbi:hypothetical protein [Hyphomicrobium sp. DY-1]|uniref:hypothetical protein n=1 Tax=Hyphomicrobium sp. DY-1 TaxID=3075650 RepID=UPI0039C3AF4E